MELRPAALSPALEPRRTVVICAACDNEPDTLLARHNEPSECSRKARSVVTDRGSQRKATGFIVVDLQVGRGPAGEGGLDRYVLRSADCARRRRLTRGRGTGR